MSDVLDIWEKPEAKQIDMIIGWRQWADAGSISSGLPQYLIDQLDARPIGKINNNGFYLFQIPGTHHLVRPVVRFDKGYPIGLDTPRNELYYTGDSQRGLVIFLGDEPQLNPEGYVSAFLEAAKLLGVRRIISLGGVYGELPYDKERLVSSIYSMPHLKEEIDQLAVNLSDYQGGASIGSYICRRASEKEVEFVGFYAFVPMYDFSKLSQIGSPLRLNDDYAAWLSVMRHNHH